MLQKELKTLTPALSGTRAKAMIKNLTPHPVNVLDENGNQIAVFMPEGLVRLSSKSVDAGNADGFRLVKTEFGEPEGLPEQEEGTFLIVSMLVKSAIPNRKDLIVPTEIIRDGNGNIVGCKSFQV